MTRNGFTWKQVAIALGLLGSVSGAIIWAYATFQEIPEHDKDIRGVKEKVTTSERSVIRELDHLREDIQEINEYWIDYNKQGTTTPEP